MFISQKQKKKKNEWSSIYGATIYLGCVHAAAVEKSVEERREFLVNVCNLYGQPQITTRQKYLQNENAIVFDILFIE